MLLLMFRTALGEKCQLLCPLYKSWTNILYGSYFSFVKFLLSYNKDQPTAAYAFSKLLPRTHNGAVVLLHFTSKTNAAILDELLTQWKSMGYRFGTLDQLCA